MSPVSGSRCPSQEVKGLSDGVYLKLFIGKTVPLPAPPHILSAVDSVEVMCGDEGRDGFQISFAVEGKVKGKVLRELIVDDPLLEPFNRVIIMVSFGAATRVLFDGFITNQEYNPGTDSGETFFTVTGEDLTMAMDREEKSETHPNQPDYVIVGKILASYAKYGLVPTVVPPVLQMVSIEVNRVPTQQGTDLQYVRALGKNHDHVFFIEPTDVPGVNKAYWGPMELAGVPQEPLSVDMGSETNVTSISFQHDAIKPTFVEGKIKEPFTGMDIPIKITSGLRPSLSSSASAMLDQSFARTKQFRDSGLSAIEAMAKAQSEVSGSVDAVSASGELDVARYMDVLRARRLVVLRGVGESYNGLYYVKKVTHNIRGGEYTQRFTLTREGLGSTISRVS